MSLNFKDVTGKGTSFDTIKADTRFEDGLLTFVEAAKVKGSGSDFKIGGSVNLVDGIMNDNEMIVTLPVSDSLPWYAVYISLANPVAAAAVIAGQQMLKKQIKQMSSAKYEISGPWEDPEVKLVGIWNDNVQDFDELAQEKETPGMPTRPRRRADVERAGGGCGRRVAGTGRTRPGRCRDTAGQPFRRRHRHGRSLFPEPQNGKLGTGGRHRQGGQFLAGPGPGRACRKRREVRVRLRGRHQPAGVRERRGCRPVHRPLGGGRAHRAGPAGCGGGALRSPRSHPDPLRRGQGGPARAGGQRRAPGRQPGGAGDGAPCGRSRHHAGDGHRRHGLRGRAAAGAHGRIGDRDAGRPPGTRICRRRRAPWPGLFHS